MSMKFNARGTTNLDWFSQNNLLQSPWTDLKSAANIKPFLINGHYGERSFEITASYGGCGNDVGWFVIGGPHCDWERFHPVPGILFSKKTHKITWNDNQGRNCFKILRKATCYCFVCYKNREITRDFLGRTYRMVSLLFVYCFH